MLDSKAVSKKQARKFVWEEGDFEIIEPPKLKPVSIAERVTNVRGYTKHSTKGKAFNVRPYVRNLHQEFAVQNTVLIGNKVWVGRPVLIPEAKQLSKQESGALGENIIVSHLRKIGHKDAVLLNEGNPSYPFDIIYDHTLVEAKTGLASNQLNAAKWSINFGLPSKKLRARIKKMSPAKKKRYYEKAYAKIIAAKLKVKAEYERRTGKPIRIASMGVILNPATKAADIYEWDGIKKQTRWLNVQDRYKGTVRYV